MDTRLKPVTPPRISAKEQEYLTGEFLRLCRSESVIRGWPLPHLVFGESGIELRFSDGTETLRVSMVYRVIQLLRRVAGHRSWAAFIHQEGQLIYEHRRAIIRWSY